MRCYGSSRPSKDFTEPDENEINELLKQSAKLILKKNVPNDHGDPESEWIKGWKETFYHYLKAYPYD
jgi:hypothetical protein